MPEVLRFVFAKTMLCACEFVSVCARKVPDRLCQCLMQTIGSIYIMDINTLFPSHSHSHSPRLSFRSSACGRTRCCRLNEFTFFPRKTCIKCMTVSCLTASKILIRNMQWAPSSANRKCIALDIHTRETDAHSGKERERVRKKINGTRSNKLIYLSIRCCSVYTNVGMVKKKNILACMYGEQWAHVAMCCIPFLFLFLLDTNNGFFYYHYGQC